MGPCVRRDDAEYGVFADSSFKHRIPCRHSFAISPRISREFCFEHSALTSEGAGNAGRPMRPPPRVRWWKVKSTRVSQVTPESPGIPRAMVLTASFVLFPATGFLATVIPEKLASHELDASIGASEPHDFSVRFRRSRQKRHPRPPHPVPRS